VSNWINNQLDNTCLYLRIEALSFIEFRALPGPEGRALRGKTIGSVISNFGFLVFLDHLQN
jgi:hypothetical protein